MKKKRSNFSRCGYNTKAAEKYKRRIANMNDEQLARLRAQNAERQRRRRLKRTQQEVDQQRSCDAQRKRELYATRTQQEVDQQKRRDAQRKRETYAKTKPTKPTKPTKTSKPRSHNSCDNHDITKSVNNFIYACFWPKCDTSFSSNLSLLRHMKTSHNECDDSSSVHIKLKRNKSLLCCDDFDIECVNANQSSDEIHVCDKCDKKFKTVRLLNDHTIVHMDKPFKCDFCEQRYDNINDLLDHRAIVHFNKNIIKCSECGYKSESNNVYSHQRRVHKKEKNFNCEEAECNGKGFFSKHCLAYHRKQMHSTERFDCIWPGCERSFKSVNYLNTHLEWHSGSSKFQCDEHECAGKIFSSKAALNIHRQCVHSDERPFACDWPGCSASFKVKGFLSIHVKGVHNKGDVKNASERKFKCSHCDFSATSKPILHTHIMRVHKKVKKFICDVLGCNGKSFCVKRELLDHKNSVHSDVRPFVCDWPQCNSAFKLKNNLKIHIKKIHTRI